MVRKLFLPHCNKHLCCHSPFFSLSINTSQPRSKVTVSLGAIMVDCFGEGAIRWHCGRRPELFQQVFPHSCVCGRKAQAYEGACLARRIAFFFHSLSSLIFFSNMRPASNMRNPLDAPSRYPIQISAHKSHEPPDHPHASSNPERKEIKYRIYDQ